MRKGEAPAEPQRRLFALGAVIVSLCCPILLAQDATPSTARDAIYENAKRHFAEAIFYKPDSNENILPSELAPLIVQEVAPDNQAQQRAMKLGRLGLDQAGQVQIDLDSPTVYIDERAITIAGRSYTERVFSLYFRPENSSTDAGMMQSIHTILDADSFPLTALVWDVWFQERRQRCCYSVFVSDTLEDLARERFGLPLSDYRFSIQRRQPNPMHGRVPALFSRGPVPMGPYMYFDAEGYITTILCRCSPSQMDDVAETHNYLMEPIERALALREKLAGRPREEFPLPPKSAHVAHLLESALRWPFDLPKEDKPDESR